MEHTQEYDLEMLYRRQFIAGPWIPHAFGAWPTIRLSPSFVVGCHPDLAVTTVSGERTAAVCLGHILDPHHPERGNTQVIEQLLRAGPSFLEFELELNKLAGRFVLFVSLQGQHRVYHDAGGLKSVFFYVDPTERHLWIGSQPCLFEEGLGLQPDQDVVSQFWSTRGQSSWVCELTAYRGVRQLLPNHYLDLEKKERYRFWPRERLASWTLDRAALEMADIIHGVIKAVTQRGPTALPLTGGYESRVSLSCARELRERIPVFVVDAPNTLHHDRLLSRRIAAQYGLKLSVLGGVPFDQRFWNTLLRNTAEMFLDQGMNHVRIMSRHFPNHYLLIGSMGTVARAWYYQDGRLPATIDAEVLANVTGFGGNRLATEALRQWYDTVPLNTGVSSLDLLFWEHRQGNWASMEGTAFDSVGCDMSAPYNSRELMEIALGVDVEHRKPPHQLLRRICLATAGEAVGAIPINQHWIEDLIKQAAKPIPYRVWYWYFRARMKSAGVPPCALSDHRFY